MDHYESLIALQIINWIGGAVIWLHLRHLELRQDWLVQDTLRERLDSVEVVVIEGLSTFYLKSDKLVVNLLELALVVVEPPLLKKSKDRIP